MACKMGIPSHVDPDFDREDFLGEDDNPAAFRMLRKSRVLSVLGWGNSNNSMHTILGSLVEIQEVNLKDSFKRKDSFYSVSLPL